jgi:hypothetical protein
MSAEKPAPRPFSDLRPSGLLWLINRVVFHPRGFALGLAYPDGDKTQEPIGWRLLGDGSEVWHFNGDEDESFEAVQRTLAALDGGQPATEETP